MRQIFRPRAARRGVLLAAVLLALSLLPAASLATSDTAADGDAFAEKVNTSGITDITLTSDISTNRNLTVPQNLNLDGKTWTLSSGTVAVTGAVTPGNGRIVLTGDAVLYLMGSVSGTGTIEVGPDARLYNGASAICPISGTGTVFQKSTGIPGLNAPGTELVQTITYADGRVDSGVNGAVSGDFWLLATAESGYTALAGSASVETDAGAYRLNSGNGTLYRVYTITYDLGGGQLTSANPASYTEADAITLNNPVKQGARFQGWALGSASATPVTPCTIAQGTTGNLTYYAVYETVSGGTGGGSGSGYSGLLSGLTSGGSGSRTGGSTGTADSAADTAAAGSASTSAAPSAPSTASPQGGSAARIPSGKSAVKTSLTGGASLEMPTENTSRKAAEAFPWALVAAAVLALVGLAAAALLVKRNSDERMKRLLDRLNIHD